MANPALPLLHPSDAEAAGLRRQCWEAFRLKGTECTFRKWNMPGSPVDDTWRECPIRDRAFTDYPVRVVFDKDPTLRVLTRLGINLEDNAGIIIAKLYCYDWPADPAEGDLLLVPKAGRVWAYQIERLSPMEFTTVHDIWKECAISPIREDLSYVPEVVPDGEEADPGYISAPEPDALDPDPAIADAILGDTP